MKTKILAVLFAALLSSSAYAQGKPGLEGVWSITEVTTTGPNGSTKVVSQPSMYLFTKKHYSIIYVSSDSPRATGMDVDKATADELRNTFVRSFIANAGTYEIKSGKITFHPLVAKSPDYMQPNVFSTSSFKIDGNTMTLVSDSSNTGPSTNPTTFKLKRIE